MPKSKSYIVFHCYAFFLGWGHNLSLSFREIDQTMTVLNLEKEGNQEMIQEIKNKVNKYKLCFQGFKRLATKHRVINRLMMFYVLVSQRWFYYTA